MNKYTTRAFGYHMLTPATMEEYEVFIKTCFTEFSSFYRKNRKYSLEKAFQQWWLRYGPMGFYTNSDSTRFKRELYKYVIGKLEELYNE